MRASEQIDLSLRSKAAPVHWPHSHNEGVLVLIPCPYVLNYKIVCRPMVALSPSIKYTENNSFVKMSHPARSGIPAYGKGVYELVVGKRPAIRVNGLAGPQEKDCSYALTSLACPQLIHTPMAKRKVDKDTYLSVYCSKAEKQPSVEIKIVGKHWSVDQMPGKQGREPRELLCERAKSLAASRLRPNSFVCIPRKQTL